MDLGITGRTALVLGAGGGLGSVIAATLAREGVRVASADLDATTAERTAAAIVADGGQALALEWDLADLARVEPAVTRIEAELGAIDMLIAITGGPPPGGIIGQPADRWRGLFESMVLSVFAVADRVLPGMRERGWGRIVHFDLFGRGGADSQPRTFQCAALHIAWLVEDARH